MDTQMQGAYMRGGHGQVRDDSPSQHSLFGNQSPNRGVVLGRAGTDNESKLLENMPITHKS